MRTKQRISIPLRTTGRPTNGHSDASLVALVLRVPLEVMRYLHTFKRNQIAIKCRQSHELSI